MSISDELISLREASKISGYHSDYLSFLIRSNKLKGHRVGRMWVVCKSDFEKFLKQPRNSTLKYNKNSTITQSNIFYKISRVIFTTFLVVFFSFLSFHIIKNPDSLKKIANNTYQKNDY